MLAQRRHRGGGTGGGGTPPPPVGGGVLLSYGNSDAVHGDKQGGGYQTQSAFDYMQGVIELTNIVQVDVGSGTAIALDNLGRVYTFANGEVGNAGIGDASVEIYGPVQVKGGVHLYPQMDIVTKGETWRQRLGPIGPVLPVMSDAELAIRLAAGEQAWKVVAVSSAAAHCCALTSDGRLLGWGSNNSGALANGWESDAAGDTKRAQDQKTLGAYPQQAPFWYLTEGPLQSETGKNPGGMKLVSGVEGTSSAVWSYDSPWGDGRGANVATGIKAAIATQHGTFCLKGDEVWYSGFPAGRSLDQRVYLTKDATWEPTNPAHLPAGYHVAAIAATKVGYLLLLSNGTVSQNLVRYVGYVREYLAGDGKLESTKTNIREVCVPSSGPGAPITGVIAIAKGDYGCKFLFANGTVGTCGSNSYFQNGLDKEQWEHEPYVVTIPLSRKAIAISADGEEGQGPPVSAPEVPGHPTGNNGGDMCAIVLDNNTVAHPGGIGYLPAFREGTDQEIIGSLGTGDSDHHKSPVVPLGNPQNIIQATAGVVQTMLLQAGGTPPLPSLEAFCPVGTTGTVLVRWRHPSQIANGLPVVRPAEGYEVKLVKGSTTIGYKAGPLEREHTFTGVASGLWKAIVNEQQTAVEPAFTAGFALSSGRWLGTPSGGFLLAKWTDPPTGYDEARWILEWHYAGTFLDGKGNVSEEVWTRVTPDPLGAARSYNIPIPASKNGITGAIEGRLYGDFSGRKGNTEGAYKKRQREVVVP